MTAQVHSGPLRRDGILRFRRTPAHRKRRCHCTGAGSGQPKMKSVNKREIKSEVKYFILICCFVEATCTRRSAAGVAADQAERLISSYFMNTACQRLMHDTPIGIVERVT